jgi:hypothetical protein
MAVFLLYFRIHGFVTNYVSGRDRREICMGLSLKGAREYKKSYSNKWVSEREGLKMLIP